jgi:hypothetical protein
MIHARPLLLITLGLCLASAAGCAFMSYTARAIVGPEKVPALYEPIDQKTVIVVDDPSHQLTAVTLGDVIAAVIAREFTDNKVISDIVGTEAVNKLRAENKDFDTWPVDRIGQAVGAKQVLYVLVSQFTLGSDGGGYFKPAAAMRVKFIDATNGRRLFPVNDQTGQPVASTMFFKKAEEDSRTTLTTLSRELAQRVGEDVARTFYKHEVRDELRPTRDYQ